MKIYFIFVKLKFNLIMPSTLSTHRYPTRGNNSASTPKPKTKAKAPAISSQQKTLIQRRKKQVTKNLLERTHLNGKSKRQRRLALEKLRKKPLVSEKFERIQLYANSRNLLQSPNCNKTKEDAKFVKKFFKGNNSTINISKGLWTNDYGIMERYTLLHIMSGVYQAHRNVKGTTLTPGDTFFSAINYFAGSFSGQAKYLIQIQMEKDENLEKRLVGDYWWSSVRNQWYAYKAWCLKYHPNKYPDPMAYALERAKTRKKANVRATEIAKTEEEKEVQEILIFKANLIHRGMANLGTLAREYNQLCDDYGWGKIKTRDVTGRTMGNWVRNLKALTFRQRLLPLLTERHRMQRLKWALDEIFYPYRNCSNRCYKNIHGHKGMELLSARDDIDINSLSDKWKQQMNDTINGTGKDLYGYVSGAEDEVLIHVDEKFFLQLANGTYVRVLKNPVTGDYYLPGCPRVGSKRHIGKIMAWVAAGRPMYDDNGVCIFDGKVMCDFFVEDYQAKRDSKNYKKDDWRIRNINVKAKETCDMLQKLAKIIVAKILHLKHKTIRIQFDNATPHVAKQTRRKMKTIQTMMKNGTFKDAEGNCCQPGWNIKFDFQPARSPDCNILDLACFRMMGSKVRIYGPFQKLEHLRDKILEVWENEVTPDLLSKAFIMLNCVLRLIIIHHGDNDFRLPHSKNRERFKKAKEAQMKIPMVRFAITKKENDAGWNLVEAWTNEYGDDSIALNSIDDPGLGLAEDDLETPEVEVGDEVDASTVDDDHYQHPHEAPGEEEEVTTRKRKQNSTNKTKKKTPPKKKKKTLPKKKKKTLPKKKKKTPPKKKKKTLKKKKKKTRVIPMPKSMDVDSDSDSDEEDDNPQATEEEAAEMLRSLGYQSGVIINGY